MLEEPVSSSAPTFWAVINSWFTPTVFFVVLQLVIATIYITSNIANNANQKQHQQNPQGGDTRQPQQLPRSPSTLERLKSINFHSYTYRSQQPPLQVQNDPPSQTHEGEEEQHAQIPRSPTMLQRLKSINLHSYFPSDTTHESAKQHHLDHDGMLKNHEPEKHHLEDTTVLEETDEEEEEKAVPSLDEVYIKLIQGQGRHFNRSQSDTTAPASGEVPLKLPRKMKKSASTKSAFSHFKEDDVIAVENRRPVSVREGRVSAAVDGGGDDDGVDAKADDFINKFKEQLKLQRLDSVTRYNDMTIGGGSGK